MLNIPNEIELQHRYLKELTNHPMIELSSSGYIGALIERGILIPCLSYSRYIPLQLRLMYHVPEIHLEIIPVPDGKVYHVTNPDLILKKNLDINCPSFPELQGKIHENNLPPGPGAEEVHQYITQDNELLIVELYSSPSNLYKLTAEALIRKDQVLLTYHSSYPLGKYFQGSPPDDGLGLEAALSLELSQSLLQALQPLR